MAKFAVRYEHPNCPISVDHVFHTDEVDAEFYYVVEGSQFVNFVAVGGKSDLDKWVASYPTQVLISIQRYPEEAPTSE